MADEQKLVETARERFDLMLKHSYLLYSHAEIDAALDRIAGHLNSNFQDSYPLVLSVMGGAVVFVGHMMPRLTFALEFNYVHLSRYGDTLIGGTVNWQMGPLCDMTGRTVIIFDDIVDSGRTLVALRERLSSLDVKHVEIVSLCNRVLPPEQKHDKPDYAGLNLETGDFIFGFGMDACLLGRNLAEIRAIPNEYQGVIFPQHAE